MQTLESWIIEVLTDPEKGKCTALTCIHKVGSSDDEVYGIKLGEKQWNVKELAEIFMHKAKTTVQEETGSQLFQVKAFYDSVQAANKFNFRINGGAELGGGSTEEPTDRGERAQRMRHGEAAFQFAFKHSQELFRMSLEMNRDLMKGYREAMSENADAIKLVKELILERATHNHDLKMKEMTYLQSIRREDQLMKMLPAVANTVTGREVFPQGTQDTAIVEMMLANMTEEQIKMFAMTLPPEVQGIVAARAAEYFKNKREAEAIARQVAETAEPETHELADEKAAAE
jgi:hypothetical protein